MKIEEFAQADFLRAPWPTLVDGTSIPSVLPQAARCSSKCPMQKECAGNTSIGEYTCRHGMSYMVGIANEQVLTVYGIRTDQNSVKLSSQNRSWYSGRRLDSASVLRWLDRATEFEGVFRRSLADAQTGLLDVLHDPVRLAKQINTIANRMARSGAPDNVPLSRIIENAPPDMKTLVKASEMLSDSFGLLTIYMNPPAATFGRQIATNLHGLVTKIVAILRTIDDGPMSGWRDIRVTGSCLKNVMIHESFKLIPFALLTNAIKYSPPGKPIFVSINDVASGGVEVAVTSTGPYIEPTERANIFNKNFRGRWASTYEGRGVGLYLADIVAKAHHTTIEVVSTDLRERVREVPMATNRFSLRVVS